MPLAKDLLHPPPPRGEEKAQVEEACPASQLLLHGRQVPRLLQVYTFVNRLTAIHRKQISYRPIGYKIHILRSSRVTVIGFSPNREYARQRE